MLIECSWICSDCCSYIRVGLGIKYRIKVNICRAVRGCLSAFSLTIIEVMPVQSLDILSHCGHHIRILLCVVFRIEKGSVLFFFIENFQLSSSIKKENCVEKENRT